MDSNTKSNRKSIKIFWIRIRIKIKKKIESKMFENFE